MGKRKGPDPDCTKCDGEGWLWWYELDHYSGPGLECGSDDTQYSCDACHKKDEESEMEVPLTVGDQLTAIRELLKECGTLHASLEKRKLEATQAEMAWKQAEVTMMEVRKQRDKLERDYARTKERLGVARLQLSLMMEAHLPVDPNRHINCGAVMNLDGFCGKCSFHVCRMCQGNRDTCGHFVGHGAL